MSNFFKSCALTTLLFSSHGIMGRDEREQAEAAIKAKAF